ncbi:alpha/beta fold hydrolase [Caenimonas terrae]|uniref:Alpha/beta fold hydrolase n=1 Tax=Caenimonas terrae TaxID=696074 RepID=A0ABW0NFB4_9BURK
MMNDESFQVSTPTDRSIAMTRLFDAPPAVVFEAWTRAEHISKWWDPSGAPLAACEVDLRPGGCFRWVNSGQPDFPFEGVYRQIEPAQLLVFTTRGAGGRSESVATLLFHDVGGRTRLDMTIVCGSAQERDALLAMRVDVGTGKTLANLARHLAGMAAAAGPGGPGRTSGTVLSRDGTRIGFDRVGQGLPLILVDGALCYRGMGASGQLAELLASRFTVFTYDRRGRGTSGDTPPYAVQREVEDIDALLQHAGGSANVWGMSSGAALGLEAAAALPGIARLALYEAPFIVDRGRPTTQDDWRQIGAALAAGRSGHAVALFMKSVGVPAIVRAAMRLLPAWNKLRAIAHTLAYDGALVGDKQLGQPLDAARWRGITIPVLVMDGEKSAAWMRAGNRALAAALPGAAYVTLPGQTHMLKPRAHAPALAEFFSRP